MYLFYKILSKKKMIDLKNKKLKGGDKDG